MHDYFSICELATKRDIARPAFRRDLLQREKQIFAKRTAPRSTWAEATRPEAFAQVR